MKIGVCIKQVPDTEAKIVVRADGTGISEENMKFIISPYDAYAIEEALKTREAKGGEVVVLSVGPARAAEAIRTALSLGCDRGLHGLVEKADELDPLATARILAAMVKSEGLEVVFCGRQAADQDNSQVPQMLATLLDWPCTSVVSALEWGEGKVRARRDVEGGGREIIEMPLPAVIGATKGLNLPRFASLKEIMAAKKKGIKAAKPEEWGAAVGASPRLVYQQYKLPPERKPGRVIDAETPEQAAAEVVRLLREEAKII